jgi:transcriptional regulator with XRE-family HTH domain
MSSSVATDSIQTRLLEQIRNRLPEHVNLADELAELLSISRDSAYRRIRGETVLSLDEAKKLYDRFGVSIDEMFSPDSNKALFHHRALTLSYTWDQWLESVSRNLETIMKLEDQNKEMVFAAKDIPIFHYFRLPELSAFKMFFWMKCLIKDPKYAQKLYDPDVVPRELTALGTRVFKLYAAIPTTEIWTEEAINDTLKQISFFHDCGYFADPKYARLLCDQLIQLNNIIKEEAAEGKTTEGNTFKMYENEILIADNTILARMGHKRSVYINYNSLNLLQTLQESFCDKTEAYLDNLIKNSTLLSATSAKERNRFFTKMNDRIDALKKKLEA